MDLRAAHEARGEIWDPQYVTTRRNGRPFTRSVPTYWLELKTDANCIVKLIDIDSYTVDD
jgi:hypothetical protein